ncbi:MAG TPA: hypothetical protein PK683_18730, partial [Leptospiraceae bacterium]|nr:hypothetical protein [Leptospiraceae bacterium]
FSGFTVTSTEKSYLEDRDYIRNEEWFLRYLEKPNNVEPFPFDESILEGAKVEKIEKTYYTVYNIQYGKPLDDCSVENNSRVVFVNKKTRQAYSIQGLYKEDLVSHGNLFLIRFIHRTMSATAAVLTEAISFIFFLRTRLFLFLTETRTAKVCAITEMWSQWNWEERPVMTRRTRPFICISVCLSVLPPLKVKRLLNRLITLILFLL